MARGNPRRGNGARRDATLKRLRHLARPCWICGLPIDYSLPARHPLSFECDELVPVSRGGSPYSSDNVDAAHRCCNSWRSAKSVEQVERIRAEAVANGASWTSPEQFVDVAKGVERSIRQNLAVFRTIVNTTTDW